MPGRSPWKKVFCGNTGTILKRDTLAWTTQDLRFLNVTAAPYEIEFQKWKTDPSPGNLFRTVEALNPVISHSLTSIGAADDPVLRSHAKLFAAEAVKKFDPASGASLPTWTSGQLQQLRRLKRQSQAVTRVSESAQLDAFSLAQAEKEFMDKHGREPDVVELADFAKMPVKRIEKVRRTMRKTPSEQALGEVTADSLPDTESEALEYVHRDSDQIDRQIIEMKTGFGGKHAPMAPKDIAFRLRLTPTQLSRRSVRLALKLQEIEEALKSIV